MKKAILRVFFKPLTIINRIKKKDEKLKIGRAHV